VTVIEHSTVILSCRIANLGDRMVFWIRSSDLQILTAGSITFSSDDRFKVNQENSVDPMDWSLLITNVKLTDQGAYECQINTEPKMARRINLTVKGVPLLAHILFMSTAAAASAAFEELSWGIQLREGSEQTDARKYEKMLHVGNWIENGSSSSKLSIYWNLLYIYLLSFIPLTLMAELSDVMEMDSPFLQHGGATIEGKNSNVLKAGSTITLTCKIMENEMEEQQKQQQQQNSNPKRIDWRKDGNLLSEVNVVVAVVVEGSTRIYSLKRLSISLDTSGRS